MKKSISLLALLIFLSTSMFAQKSALITKRNSNHAFLKGRLEKQENNPVKEKRIAHFRNLITKKPNHSLKSTDVIKQRLDSLYGKYWNADSSKWISMDRNEFIYDNNGNNTDTYGCEFDEIGIMHILNHEECTYDANGKLTEMCYYEWDDNITWYPVWKESIEYNTGGNPTQVIDYVWSETGSSWTPDYKADFTYDATGNLTQCIDYTWDENSSQWIISSKGEFTYNANNGIILEIYYEWDEYSSLWVAVYKCEYSYDGNGNMIQEIEYERENTQWIAYYKADYSYDAGGHMIQEIEYERDENTGLWIALFKCECVYDSEGNLSQEIYYLWDDAGNQWNSESKYEYSHNNSFSFSDLLLPVLFSYESDGEDLVLFNHMLTDVDEYLWDGSQWIPDYKFALYYSPQDITSVSEPNAASMKVSPNPVKDYLTVTLDKNYENARFELFDMQGKKVLTESVTNHSKVNLQGLNPGIYYYNIIAGQERQSGKLIKK